VFLVVAQTILAAFACFGLWRLLKSVMSYGRAPAWIVAGGFLARALLGQLLFWISYLRLPYGRSLQLGPGFWFFGLDAQFYYKYAAQAAEMGPRAILQISDSIKARFFVQAIAVFVELFGTVPSVGILLNCFLYAGICVLIARMGARDGRLPFPALIALAAVSFSPAGVLWSTQPLKDPFFLFLILAAIALSLKWHELWTLEGTGERSGERTGVRVAAVLAGIALLMAALVYGISTIRWYFGLLFLMSCIVMFVWQAIASKRRLAALFTNVLMFVVLMKSAALGASTDLPPFLRDTFHFRAGPEKVVAIPSEAAAMVQDAKRGFEQTPGATNILPGAALDEKPAPEPLPEPVPAIAAAREPEPPPAQAPAPAPAPAPEAAEPPPAVTETTATVSPAPAPAPAVVETAAAHAVHVPAATETAVPPAHTPVTDTAAAAPHPTTSAEVTPAPQPEPSRPAPPKRAAKKKPAAARPPAAAPAPVPIATTTTATPAPPAPDPQLTIAPTPTPTPVPAPPAPDEYVPSSFTDRLISGVSATLIPRAIAQKAGLIRVGGGRGFWFFADIDTIVFDIVLVFSVVYCVRRLVRTRGRMTPMFVQVMLVFMIVAVPLIYAISNFGTLFRHRQMIYLGLCLLPMALAGRGGEERETGDPATAM
jgi:hypothetical protein